MAHAPGSLRERGTRDPPRRCSSEAPCGNGWPFSPSSRSARLYAALAAAVMPVGGFTLPPNSEQVSCKRRLAKGFKSGVVHDPTARYMEGVAGHRDFWPKPNRVARRGLVRRAAEGRKE